MKVLVINSGSSSIKYQLIDTKAGTSLAKGLVDRIGLSNSSLKQSREDGHKINLFGEIFEHSQALEYILAALTSEKHGVIKNLDEIDAVGHRLVHGGEHFKASVLITDEVMDVLNECIDLAPLHNPPNIKGVQAARAYLGKTPMVGVFDTAFHSTMPDYAYIYGIPYELYKRYGIRRYGFHGTSHRYVSQEFARMYGKEISSLKLISCHLGNGASVAAVQYGKSVDTSMGFTPLEGLVMGTRSGDVDPGVILQIAAKEDLDVSDLNNLLNKHGGMLGISGLSSDMRDIEEAMEKGDERAILAMNIYNYRLKKYIAAYAGAMGGVDGIIFTGGIGENGSITRKGALEGLEFMGIRVDDSLNESMTRGKQGEISPPDAPVKVTVIPTNEELVIALDTEAIVSKRFTE
ncbi:MAG: Acetate kinase [Marinimicrobia bacterium 46_47]|nr:MAG: Acetate kinase [Marinimicrobia bacterium 46_47]KUK93875.1 MAG: Acetate kinase [Marinimicrobia bacterium 46_43]HBY17772.1 acetate kinase [Candidatus Neomarinimicrobiota bacterium]